MQRAETLSTIAGAWRAAHAVVPHARRQERDRLLQFSGLVDDDPRAPRTVLDVPAWGGYITRDLPHPERLTMADPMVPLISEYRARGVTVVGAQLPRLPFRDGGFHRVISAVGLHHISAPMALAELARVLAPGGRLALCEVVASRHSDLGGFLDRVIGRYGRDHHGTYLTLDQLEDAVRRVGLDPHQSAHGCAWEFPDRAAMAFYVQHVLMLVDATLEDVEREISDSLRVVEREGGIALEWPLGFVSAVKRC